ncbi:MAG: hypothetical protein QNJ98_19540 [Planctomycetota bacterium]|nr:hypothetical protein [Planctomycetota bacterium]
MKALPQALLTVLFVAVGLWIYDTLRGDTRAPGGSGTLDGAALESRMDALTKQLRGLEDRLAAMKKPPADEVVRPQPDREVDLERLEAMVRELQRREEIERLTNGAKARLRALELGLDERQQAKALELVVAFEAERADFWRQVRHEAVADKQEIAKRFAPIRERYEASFRHALPAGAARTLIEKVMGP